MDSSFVMIISIGISALFHICVCIRIDTTLAMPIALTRSIHFCIFRTNVMNTCTIIIITIAIAITITDGSIMMIANRNVMRKKNLESRRLGPPTRTRHHQGRLPIVGCELKNHWIGVQQGANDILTVPEMTGNVQWCHSASIPAFQ